MAVETVPSICRNCPAYCPIIVTVDNGRAIKVAGDPSSAAFQGYSCPKGRAIPSQIANPDRLLHCLARIPAGGHECIPSSDALERIADRLRAIVAEHGPDSVALYMGTGTVPNPFGAAMGAAFLEAIGSRMFFTAGTIDKPAEKTASAMHGYWIAGGQDFADSDVWMIVGGNPLISKSTGLPNNNPGRRLTDALAHGMTLIVVDPRTTETAKRADIHLQPRPGTDWAILAGMISLIIRENLYDRVFIEAHAQGLKALAAAVADYTPDAVAAYAGIGTLQLTAAARAFANARRGAVQCATGPSFSMRSNLVFYLALCLNTLCGRWARAGDKVVSPNVLLPAFEAKAQPLPSYPVFGKLELAATGMRENASGMPTAGLSDQILWDGPGRIRALICLGGNPVSAWPNQPKTEAALRSLDLLMVLDCAMTGTAALADYVIPSPMAFETPAITYLSEAMKYQGAMRGYQIPWAQWVPAAVDPPEDSDLVDEHRVFFRLARLMDLQLCWTNYHGIGRFQESPSQRIPLEMGKEPSLEDVFEIATMRSRVPLSVVKRYPHGHVHDTGERVLPADPDCTDRLELAAPLMIAELHQSRDELSDTELEPAFPLSLISRRTNNFMNSFGLNIAELNRGRTGNPIYLHPDDARTLGVARDELVEVRSRYGVVRARVDLDPMLKPGVVAMSHGFGSGPGDDRDPRLGGANVNRLVHVDEHDAITGIPRMSAIPVAIVAPAPA